jgi:hypothetical protein
MKIIKESKDLINFINKNKDKLSETEILNLESITQEIGRINAFNLDNSTKDSEKFLLKAQRYLIEYRNKIMYGEGKEKLEKLSA